MEFSCLNEKINKIFIKKTEDEGRLYVYLLHLPEDFDLRIKIDVLD